MSLRKETEQWRKRGGRVEECHGAWLIPNRKQGGLADREDI